MLLISVFLLTELLGGEELEGTYKFHQVQLSDFISARHKEKHVNESIIKMSVNTDRHGVSSTCPGNLVQCLTTFTYFFFPHDTRCSIIVQLTNAP